MMCIVASSLWIQRKVMSRVLQKNKPVAYAASQDFINAILCDGLPILSKRTRFPEIAVLTLPTRSPRRGIAARLRFERHAPTL
jgi:hypothetical protein